MGPRVPRSAFFAYDRNGTQVFAATFTIPGARSVFVRSFDRGRDGTIALCGVAVDADGRNAPYTA